MTSFGYGLNLKLVMGLHYSIILFSYVVIIVLIFVVISTHELCFITNVSSIHEFNAHFVQIKGNI